MYTEKELEEAMKDITVPMVEAMGYGEEIELTEKFTLSHYCEEDIVVLVLTEEWEETHQLLIDGDGILFEELI